MAWTRTLFVVAAGAIGLLALVTGVFLLISHGS
jgi:hypothetical protein